jgi:phage tail sheath protein FI
MPVQVNYPGVYIEETPDDPHVITGVATSITAFMGTALSGPVGTSVDGPATIFSFADYQRIFGGLWTKSAMSYAVRDFFVNGGSQAIVVRLYEPEASTTAQANQGYAVIDVNAPLPPPTSPPVADQWSPASPRTDALTLYAASPGVWGNSIRARMDTEGITPEVAETFAAYGVEQADMFNLTILFAPSPGEIQVERFLNLTILDYAGFPPNPNRIDRVLNQQSQLARIPAAEENLHSAIPSEWFAEWDAFNRSTSLQNYNEVELYRLLCPATGGDDGNAVPCSTSYTDDGTRALDRVDLFNLLCIPYDVNTEGAETQAINAYPSLAQYCSGRRAMLIVDPPGKWTIDAGNNDWTAIQPGDVGIGGDYERNAAVYFPRVVEADPLLNGEPRVMPPCGLIAGLMATTDLTRGVWKAPAGVDAGLNGVLDLEINLTDEQQGVLNPLAINCLRKLPTIGPVVWGARTLRGADQLADDYKYIPIRRLALYVEESIDRGTRWAVFEPNAEPLWASLRLSINTFLADLQRQGAFYSFFVKCDATTTTPADILQGMVNIEVGLAPLEPAEFVVIRIQQAAGQDS